MNEIYIKQLSNGYLVNIDHEYEVKGAKDTETYFTTKEEMIKALPEIIEKAHLKFGHEQKQLEEQGVK